MHFENGTFGYPALAIPVEKKSEFVCPPEHVRALADDVLPNITKIITVGWRATEQNLLAMLKNPLTGLRGDVDLMVVSGNIKDVTETNANLAGCGKTYRYQRLNCSTHPFCTHPRRSSSAAAFRLDRAQS
jgi:hypothetical protein